MITNQRQEASSCTKILFHMRSVVERVGFVRKLFDWLVGRIVKTHGYNTLVLYPSLKRKFFVTYFENCYRVL
jgi:hypothetical protein